MAQITKRGATQSIFDKTALQELLPFDRITEMQCWCYVPLRALTGAPGGIGLTSVYISFGAWETINNGYNRRRFEWTQF